MSTPAGLWQGPFRWFYLGRIVDLTGSAMTPVALSLAVLAHTGSPTQMGIVLAANVTPTLAFLLLGGVLADRWQRRTIVQCSTLAAAAALVGTERLLVICAAAIVVFQLLPLTLVAVRRGEPLA